MDTRKILEGQQWLNDELNKSMVINEMINDGFVPIIKNGNIIVYLVKKHLNFLN